MSLESEILKKIELLSLEKRSALLQLLDQWSAKGSRPSRTKKLRSPIGLAKGIGRDLNLREFKLARKQTWRVKAP